MAAIPQSIIAARCGRSEFHLSAWMRETGSETLLVWVHGLGCSKQSFAGAWAQAGLRDYAMLALDLPGFGRSPRPADYSYDLEQQALLLAGVLDAHASRRICLVAHSMGGTAALLIPSRSLARLSALVLVEPRLLAASCGVAAEASRHDLVSFQAEFLPQFQRRVANDPRVAFDVERADPLAFHRSAQSLMHWAGSGEMVDRFVNAPCPDLFVYGADNAHLPELRQLPASRVSAIRGAGHFPMQDNPEQFYALIERMVASEP